jgi:hypothetical protein
MNWKGAGRFRIATDTDQNNVIIGIRAQHGESVNIRIATATTQLLNLRNVDPTRNVDHSWPAIEQRVAPETRP